MYKKRVLKLWRRLKKMANIWYAKAKPWLRASVRNVCRQKLWSKADDKLQRNISFSSSPFFWGLNYESYLDCCRKIRKRNAKEAENISMGLMIIYIQMEHHHPQLPAVLRFLRKIISFNVKKGQTTGKTLFFASWIHHASTK